jgi:GT2 family glycosyltransferase
VVRIGLIIPVRAPAPFLDDALRSALDQDQPPDDHAVVYDEEGTGPARTREAALTRLDPACDWVALLDADDEWEPGKLAAQRDAIARHPEAVVCFGRAKAIGRGGRPTGERLPELWPGLHAGRDFARILYESNPIPTSSVLVRRDALVRAGGFAAAPAPLASDWDLWLRLVRDGGAFVRDPRARIRYRRHRGGVTADVAALAESMLQVHAAHGDLVDQETRRRAEARDRVLLARGRIRQRRYREAGDVLRQADALVPLRGRERLLKRLVAVPLLRALLGRRAPYR